MKEYVDIYDVSGSRTGAVKARGDSLEAGEYIRVVHACIFNVRQEMLIQQRSPRKKLYGGRWDLSAGGHVKSGESSREAVLRELSEELGLSLTGKTAADGGDAGETEELRFAFTEPFGHVLDDMYILKVRSLDIDGLRIQKEEISRIRWAREEEIFRMAEEGTFVDYTKECLEKIFLYAEKK